MNPFILAGAILIFLLIILSLWFSMAEEAADVAAEEKAEVQQESKDEVLRAVRQEEAKNTEDADSNFWAEQPSEQETESGLGGTTVNTES